jgi:hypothetical protein
VSREISICYEHHRSVRANQPNTSERNLCLQIEPSELPESIQFVYAADRDGRHAIALEDAATIDFDQARAFRRPPACRTHLSTTLPCGP